MPNQQVPARRNRPGPPLAKPPNAHMQTGRMHLPPSGGKSQRCPEPNADAASHGLRRQLASPPVSQRMSGESVA
eukprot:6598222-Prymnesium_polylepis.2